MNATATIALTIFAGETPDVPAVEEQFTTVEQARTRLEEIANESGDQVSDLTVAGTTITFTMVDPGGNAVAHGTIGAFE